MSTYDQSLQIARDEQRIRELRDENKRLRAELADTKERLEHERAANRYLSFGEENDK